MVTQYGVAKSGLWRCILGSPTSQNGLFIRWRARAPTHGFYSVEAHRRGLGRTENNRNLDQFRNCYARSEGKDSQLHPRACGRPNSNIGLTKRRNCYISTQPSRWYGGVGWSWDISQWLVSCGTNFTEHASDPELTELLAYNRTFRFAIELGVHRLKLRLGCLGVRLALQFSPLCRIWKIVLFFFSLLGWRLFCFEDNVNQFFPQKQKTMLIYKPPTKCLILTGTREKIIILFVHSIWALNIYGHPFPFLIIVRLHCACYITKKIQTKNPISSSPGTLQLNFVYCPAGLSAWAGFSTSEESPLSCRLHPQPIEMPIRAFHLIHNQLSTWHAYWPFVYKQHSSSLCQNGTGNWTCLKGLTAV